MEQIFVTKGQDNRWCVYYDEQSLPIFESNRKELALEFASGLVTGANQKVVLIEA